MKILDLLRYNGVGLTKSEGMKRSPEIAFYSSVWLLKIFDCIAITDTIAIILQDSVPIAIWIAVHRGAIQCMK